jgi:predicted DNA-binding protein (MmcQ/YjbR family)
MTHAQFNKYCASLPHATHVVQWGGADVWKVGAKMFAIGSPSASHLTFTFKTSAEGYAILIQQPGFRPAPYLASRGMSWVQRHAPGDLKARALRDLLLESHRIVSLGLTKKLQKELGLNQG